MLFKLGQFRRGQILDALFNLGFTHAEFLEFCLHSLVVKHLQQLLPVQIHLLLLDQLTGANHAGVGRYREGGGKSEQHGHGQ